MDGDVGGDGPAGVCARVVVFFEGKAGGGEGGVEGVGDIEGFGLGSEREVAEVPDDAFNFDAEGDMGGEEGHCSRRDYACSPENSGGGLNKSPREKGCFLCLVTEVRMNVGLGLSVTVLYCG